MTLAMLAAMAFASSSSAALVTYSQDFETMTPNQGFPPNDRADDGWLIYGFAWDANPATGFANLVYDYGSSFPAANGDPGSIQGVATGEGGPDQGNVVLNKYSDYNNTDQLNLYIQALTYQEQTISADDVGLWRFSYDAKIGNIEGDSSAFAYIQTLDAIGFFQTAFVLNDSSNMSSEWGTYTLELLIDDSMIGNLLQFGFSATSTNYNGSAVFYDNLNFAAVPLPAPLWLLAGSVIAMLGVTRRKR